MGALDYLGKFCIVIGTRRKREPFKTIEIKVKMDCDGCVRKVKTAVSSMKGVKSVEVSRRESRITITGNVDPEKVLRKVKSTGKKKAEFWPYIQYNLVSYPYVVGAYDKRAPAGFVRNVPQALPATYSSYHAAPEETFANMFNDENPNACSIM